MWFSNTYCKICSPVEKVYFYAIVDHLVLNHIIKSKTEPSTNGIKRLLEVVS